MELDGAQVGVHASIGIAHHSDADDAPGALLCNADLAMYAAKRNGKGGYQHFAPAMRIAVAERADLDAALRQAVDTRQLYLHYQPIVTLTNHDIVGFEALLRWTHPERGPLSPERFVPVLEESGLIVPVGNWILRTACAQAAAWQADTGQPLSMSVNVSPRQLQQSDFVDQVAEALLATSLPPSSLILEVTEGVVIVKPDQAIRTLLELKALGVRLAVDDFGTGYSSLRYLQTLPVDSVKIDRSFIAKIQDGPDEAALARAIVNVGHALHLTVIAEGIETSQQAELLHAIGCHYGQGYYFARPQDPADIEVSLIPRDPRMSDPDDQLPSLACSG
ncbi:MAG TPA: bifunctional diguanylate cyclase/phosphodiesterase [Jatrophihabitans sp.]|nr:bifunctional diguanylate cyclase/phosphodiesterase [Jatrophihabitans sp.]